MREKVGRSWSNRTLVRLLREVAFNFKVKLMSNPHICDHGRIGSYGSSIGHR